MFAVFIGCLVLAGIAGLFSIRGAQRFMAHSVARFAEFVQPERERKGNGFLILAIAVFSVFGFLYVVGAWAALCVSISRAFSQEAGPVAKWIVLGIGFIWCLGIIPWATKLALGIGDANQLLEYIKTKTVARWEKANFTFAFAVASSTIVFWLSVLIWIVFAIRPNLMGWPYGWFVDAIFEYAAGLSR